MVVLSEFNKYLFTNGVEINDLDQQIAFLIEMGYLYMEDSENL